MHIKQWLHRIDLRQQQPTTRTELTDEQHVCLNCGTAFVGRFCPQCGMLAVYERMTSKNVLLGFLNIWGMGSQSMLRSIYELFWRPGYMIRDYLNGHQPLYFPPFEMLIYMTLFFALVAFIRGGDIETEAIFLYGDVFEQYGAAPWVVSLFAHIDKILLWLYENTAFQVIAADIFYIVASWLVFLRRMTFVEVCFSQVYISCQMQIVGAAWMLITGDEPYYNLPPFAVPMLIGIPLLCLDYAQLYRFNLWASLWRTILTFIFTLILMLLVGGLPIILVKYI